MYLIKIGEDAVTRDSAVWELDRPPLQAGVAPPQPGDPAFLWIHSAGLVAEGLIADNRHGMEDALPFLPTALFCDPLLGPSWLSGADREKTTLRSKLRCFRHSRIWSISSAEIDELDRARRDYAQQAI